jgi:hypothetical protein
MPFVTQFWHFLNHASNPLLPMVLVVANQFSLILRNSNLRNFSAFEEKVDAVLRNVFGKRLILDGSSHLRKKCGKSAFLKVYA